MTDYADLWDRVKKFEQLLERCKYDKKDYQFDGVRWCLTNELYSGRPWNGGFIADEMGLGKTIMMIGLIYANFVQNTLIIVPPVLIEQWRAQIKKMTGHNPVVYHGDEKKRLFAQDLHKAPIVISTYGAITITKKAVEEGKVTELHKVNWGRIIFDEAHHLRNEGTTRYIGARMLTGKIRWLVSGTPIQNKKTDFYSLCKIVRIPASIYNDADKLRECARSFILKRNKKQVGLDVNEVDYEHNLVDWTNVKEMELSEEIHSALKFSRVSSQRGDGKIFAETMRYKGTFVSVMRARQSCTFPKLMTTHLDKLVADGVIRDYESYKEALNSSSKLDNVIKTILARKGNGNGKLVFCQFRAEIDEIAERLRGVGFDSVATFDGRTSANKRNEILSQKNEVLILQIQTGCEGLNLQENYNEIYFVSPHWNPAIEDQAIARCDRIGQKKTVYVKRFTMSKFIIIDDDDDEEKEEPITIDKYVSIVQDCKRSVADSIMSS